MIFSQDAVVDSAFEYFRNIKGFPYRELPVHMCMQEINKLSELPYDKLETSTLGYKVADTYHPHRFHSRVHGMKSPIDGFNSDKILRRSLNRKMEFGSGIKTELLGGVGGIAITSGVQGCSNFRPAYALKLYRTFCDKDSRILDTSIGYGGRYVGFLAYGKGFYTGIDPNPLSVFGNERMAEDFSAEERSMFIESPVEDLDPKDFKDQYDFAFTSPPYFAKEQYTDEDTQSWVRYKTGEEWVEKFLYPMFRFQYEALRPNTYNLINIADVKIGTKEYPLIDWCYSIGEYAGFTLEGSMKFNLQKRIGSGHEDSEIAAEQVLIFKKG